MDILSPLNLWPPFRIDAAPPLVIGNVVAIPYTNPTDPAATDAANTRAAN